MLNFSNPAPPPLSSCSGATNKLTWEVLWFLLSKMHKEDSAKMDPLSFMAYLNTLMSR